MWPRTVFSESTQINKQIQNAEVLKIGPRFGDFCVNVGPRVVLKIGPRFFIVFPNTNNDNWCQNSVFAKLLGCQNSGFRREACIFVCLFHVAKIQNGQKIAYKTCVFFRWSSKIKKNLNKNSLTLFVSGNEEWHFRAHYLFWPNHFLAQTVKLRKTIRSGSSGNLSKTKQDICFEKVLFGMGKKCFFQLCF